MEPKPFDNVTQWAERLSQIASQPLAMCPQFPQIAARFDAWWQGGMVDRPVFIAHGWAGKPAPRGKCIELMDNPRQWLAARKQQLENLVPFGDGLPSIRVDLGPASLGGMLGGRVDVSSDTVWTHPQITDDYANAPDGVLRDDNRFWRYFRECLDVLAADAAGNYLVMAPDAGGCSDTLTNLRGPDNLSLDMIEQPERAIEAMDRMYPAWHEMFATLYDTAVLKHGAGVLSWLGLWSSKPYTITNCDFNALIGPADFARVFLPEIDRVARSAGRAVFHLDGPDAARHAPALAELDSLDAIQYTPGTGTPSAVAKADMLKHIQSKGKSLFIFVPADEVMPLLDLLDPNGLVLFATGPQAQCEAALAEVNQRFGVK